MVKLYVCSMSSFISSSVTVGGMLWMRMSVLIVGLYVGRIVASSRSLSNLHCVNMSAYSGVLNVSMYPVLSRVRVMFMMCLLYGLGFNN